MMSQGVAPAQATMDALFSLWLTRNKGRIESIIEDVQSGRPLELPHLPHAHPHHGLPSPARSVSAASESTSDVVADEAGVSGDEEVSSSAAAAAVAASSTSAASSAPSMSPLRVDVGHSGADAPAGEDGIAGGHGLRSPVRAGSTPPKLLLPSPTNSGAAGGVGAVSSPPGLVSRPPLSPKPVSSSPSPSRRRTPNSRHRDGDVEGLLGSGRGVRGVEGSGGEEAGGGGAGRGVIPRFFVPGEGGRGRGKADGEQRLEKKLAEIVEVWKAQHAEMLRKQPLLAAKEEEFGRVIGDSGVVERCAGVEVKVEDASLGLSVEQFAAVAKALCGFPSFFAAPLFRRMRHLVGSGSLAEGDGDGVDEEVVGEERKEEEEGGGGGGGGGEEWRGRGKGVGSDENAAMSDLFRGYDGETRGVIRLRAFLRYWRRELEPRDEVDRFLRLVAKVDPVTSGANAGQRVIEPADFMPFLEELLAFHPGLAFLETTPEFQEKYARTVVARFFYHLDPEGTQQITARQIRRGKPNLVDAFHTVDMEEDINAVTEYFSYEAFFCIFVSFFDLDEDRDFLLSRADLSKLQNITEVCLDRVFAGAGKPRLSPTPDRMSYEDYLAFLISEEDKTSEVALRYWFRVVDVDGDGVITRQDMRYFYDEQFLRMQELGLEAVKLDDIVTQMTDLINPEEPGRFKLKDFLHPTRVKLTGVFFSALFNVAKFQAFESRDPVLVKQELNSSGVTQWDRYVAFEYMRLADEEERGAQEDAAIERAGAASAHPDDEEDELVGMMQKTTVS